MNRARVLAELASARSALERAEVALGQSCESGGVDELVALDACGLEQRAWRALIASKELAARKIGRRWYSTRAALAALVPSVTKVPAVVEEKPADDYAQVVQMSARRARRSGVSR